MNNINFEKSLPMYIFESCIYCGRFIRTKDKARIILFMMDHYGKEGIRKCSKRWYGNFVYTLLNWRYRNI